MEEKQMQCENFRIVASPSIVDAYCECGSRLKEVDNGWISSVMKCPKCDNIYELKLIKVPKNKIPDKFIVPGKEYAQKEESEEHDIFEDDDHRNDCWAHDADMESR